LGLFYYLELLRHNQPAVYFERLPGHVAGIFLGKEGDHAGNFPGFGQVLK